MSVKLTNIDSTKQVILIGIAISLVVPVIAWIIDIVAGTNITSPSLIVSIHLSHPSLFILDLVPIATGVILFFLLKVRNRENNQYETFIRERDELIEKNADFAGRIGQGDYTSPFQPNGDKDPLGTSLLLMRDNLLRNTRKESEQSWISAGKDQISNILRIHNKIDTLAYETLISLIKYSIALTLSEFA